MYSDQKRQKISEKSIKQFQTKDFKFFFSTKNRKIILDLYYCDVIHNVILGSFDHILYHICKFVILQGRFLKVRKLPSISVKLKLNHLILMSLICL